MSNGSTTWTYTYNADGMRKSRSNGSTTYNYVYNGGKLIQMTRGTDTLEFYYDTLGVPVIVKYNGEVYNYVTTLQGDVMLILDTDGEITVEYAYDAWGGHVTVGGSMANTLGTLNPLTYRGYVYDRETGLYYLQSRYYNPEIGRFINADVFIATGQGLLGNNMFAYCQNNASMLSDPTGTIEADCISSEANPFVDSWRSVGSGGGLITAAFTCVVGLLIVNESRVAPRVIVKNAKKEKKGDTTPPDVTYPGDDPTKAPEGTEWKGKGEQGSNRGNYHNPETGESWHPDLDHPEPIGPHWDYKDSNGTWWRIGKNNILVLK